MKNNVIEQPITGAIEQNYMPYAMSVIMSRAIPEIDGFKPAHRKILYTMYKMGLLTSGRSKSANIVGQTMRLNPHGDQAIYETMVRLSRGYSALLTPFIDSKGNFGKVYSRDMAFAASRYTEAKLDSICTEIFRDIDKDCIDFVDNYDNTMKEPALLPTTFPNILVSANTGIAVGMASSICGFNLKEVCETTIEYIKNPQHDIISTLKAPDFPTGGEIILNRADMDEIYRTGRGTFKVRAKWEYIKKGNMIEITEIPYTTTVEAIIDKVSELIKNGKVKEIADMRDETDLSGLKLTIDLKRGTDPDVFMQKIMQMTPLMDTFACNFNILIAGTPKVMGIAEILEEWTAWRIECQKRKLYFELTNMQKKLHLLLGLRKILLDIDKAIKIIRETEAEDEVIPNLMIGFGIDEIQAEYIAEIKLRNINKQYILKRLDETDSLSKEIERTKDIIKNKDKIKGIIIAELEHVIKKYSCDRKTAIVYDHQVEKYKEEEHIEDYQVRLFLTHDGYFKKITPLSLRMGGEHKLKEGDRIIFEADVTNKSEIIVLTNKQQAYKAQVHEFDDTKASALGDYLPSKLGMDEGETTVAMVVPGDYSGHLIFVFRNGKVARVELSSYYTKSNRKKLSGAYSDKSEIAAVFHIKGERKLALYSNAGRLLIVDTAQLSPKTTRATAGVSVMTLKKNQSVSHALYVEDANIENQTRYKTRTLPAAGAIIRDEDAPDRQTEIPL